MILHQRLITRRICKSYSIWILLVVDQSKDSKQTNNSNEQLKCKNETILAIKWNQQKPVIRTK